MAKKTGQQATFIVRFSRKGLSPAEVPLRAVSDALSAAQDLASGRDYLETPHVPPDKAIGLVDVRRGSAKYFCAARAPEIAVENLSRIGSMLSSLNDDDATIDDERLVASIRPIRILSALARQNDCRMEIVLKDDPGKPVVTIEKGDFRKIAGKLFMKGDANITGEIERVGGATEMRCLMRIPGRRRLLYCDVKGETPEARRELVRQLGQHLYENISATGKAIWINRTWYIYKFSITGFAQPKLGNPFEAIDFLRKAGLNAWDSISDPESVIREQRQ